MKVMSEEDKASRKRQFIQKACKLHNNFYSYEKTEYVNGNTPVIITCPEHGNFSLKPSKHINREQKCPQCSGYRMTLEERWEKIYKHFPEGFYSFVGVEEAKSVHSKVGMSCPIHGITYKPLRKIQEGHGCKGCISEKYRKDLPDLIEEFKEVHKNKYDYSKFNYSNSHTKGVVICKRHGEFSISASKHLMGRGCKECGYEGVSPFSLTLAERHRENYIKTPCHIYFIHLEKDLYKIGISKEKETRYKTIARNSNLKVNEVASINTNLYSAIKMESHLHNLMERYRANGLTFVGKTECFVLDLQTRLKVETFLDRMAFLERRI